MYDRRQIHILKNIYICKALLLPANKLKYYELHCLD